MTTTRHLSCATALLLLVPGAAFAQEQPGAPAWIKPGMRITFYVASATTGSGEILEPDDQAMEKERQKAQKKADETGERQHYTYWKNDRGQQYSLNESPGLSGQAYLELNVAAIDRTSAALDMRLYAIDPGSGVVRAPTPTGQVVAAHTGGDFWMHPAVLRQLAGSGGTKEVAVQSTACELRGRTYQAVRIRVRGADGYTQRIYDATSGVLLRMSAASLRKAHAWVPEPGGTSRRGGEGTMLSEGWLVGTRQLKVPWIGLPAPDWVAKTRTLRYAGTQGAFVPGTGPMGFPLSVRISVRRAGPDWFEFNEAAEVTSPYGQPPQQAEATRVAGTNQLGGFWVPPAALAQLQAGQQLDNDSVTQVRVVVESAAAGRVALLETGAEHRTRYVYDRATGILVATSQEQQVGPSTAQMSVELQGRE
ncbi:MAG: hypothetical protein ACOZE5_13750 [Verrucomicrobiota bacterium]